MVGIAAEYRPWAPSPAVRKVMHGNRKRDTRPEVALRRALHAEDIRDRVGAKPDRHGCPQQHYAWPRTNPGCWSRKIDSNYARDAPIDLNLRAAKLTALLIWEHESMGTAADCVAVALSLLGDRG
jgi:DNA mismatch endonuclease, patch repair protein